VPQAADGAARAPATADELAESAASGAGSPAGGGRGRHARRADAPPFRPPRADYVPRHSVDDGEDISDRVSATELTEVFARIREDPTEPPRTARPDNEPVARAPAKPGRPAKPQGTPKPTGSAGAPPRAEALSLAAMVERVAERTAQPESVPPSKRERVVLSSRTRRVRAVRTVVDVQEDTQVGAVLRTHLIRSQLALAMRIGGTALIVLGSLPAMFVIFPGLGRYELFGVRLPWLLLGVLVYPFLLGLGWLYTRSAEKLEQIFTDHIHN
jgi:hypothetical protein